MFLHQHLKAYLGSSQFETNGRILFSVFSLLLKILKQQLIMTSVSYLSFDWTGFSASIKSIRATAEICVSQMTSSSKLKCFLEHSNQKKFEYQKITLKLNVFLEHTRHPFALITINFNI